MIGSIHGRLLLVASLVIAAFLGLGALALDQAFRESIDSAMRERLLQQVYALLGAASEDAEGRMRLPKDLPNPRLATPDSGLYAVVIGEEGGYLWRSRSLIGREIGFSRQLDQGVVQFDRFRYGADDLYTLNFAIAWDDDSGKELVYTLAVAENTEAMDAQIGAFRTRLFYWLGGVSLLLLIVQVVVLGWGLKPLRRVAADLRRVERGKIEAIEGDYPKELRGLIRNINMLIQSSKATRDRYRNSLGDLAHSLKTPLTLLRGAAVGEDAVRLRQTVDEQVTRMDEIVQYQLQRAAVSSMAVQGSAVSVATVVERLCATLAKVYRDKGIQYRLEIDPEVLFFGEQQDLMEFMGNLLDNAFKYGKERIKVTAHSLQTMSTVGGQALSMTIEDDGPGIPEEQREKVLNRGVRIDQQLPGQGIGLSMAREIISLYGGSLTLDGSEMGGVLVKIVF